MPTESGNGHLRRVDQLHRSDVIDLEGDRYADPNYKHPDYMASYQIVASTVRETENCVRVYLDDSSPVLLPANHYVRYLGRWPRDE